jgi:translation initiation factor IF-2
MRARGAQGADIAVMVVAADDGVMPTTREALNHVRAADVPFVVAVTKVDKPNANPELVKQGMSELNVIPDEWGGEYMFVPVAATKGQGVDDLLEALLLLAEERDIVANPKANPSGIVLEAQMDPNRGVIATLLVLNGTLKRGDTVMIGNTYGRVKAMFDESGKQVKDAPPSTPVAIMGISDMPSPGDSFNWVDSEKTARKLIQEREANEVRDEQRRRPTLEELFARFEAGDTKELTLILKADVQGSIQPIVEGLEKLSAQGGTESITVKILSQETGNISENDVNLASSAGAIIIGFNVSVDNAAQRVATNLGVDIRIYNIIYKLFESIELALNGMLEPVYENVVIGHAEVRAVYRISKIGAIAGSYILDGEARRNASARVLRKSQVILEKTGVSSLKRVNDDVKEVRSGFECGIGLANFTDFQEGDVIEFYVTQRVN